MAAMEIVVLAEPGALPPELVSALEALGAVRTVERAGETEHAIDIGGAELVVFDPRLAGADFVRRVRRRHPQVGLVARLEHSSTTQAAELFEDGADEVVDGTMGERELRGRLRRIVERAPADRPAAATVGELSVDPAHGEARWRGAELMLTPREREVLHVLAAAEGRAVRREVIYREVWGYTMARGDRSVDVNVKRLRDKLAGAVGAELGIKTLPGVGYRLELAGRVEPVTAS